ncbi:hypothetical protein PGIGA_G00043630, partial [Pangasianodon gigas]|nr:hypothetical protein [Pangasianodon gigas]
MSKPTAQLNDTIMCKILFTKSLNISQANLTGGYRSFRWMRMHASQWGGQISNQEDYTSGLIVAWNMSKFSRLAVISILSTDFTKIK